MSGTLKLMHPFMPFITEEIWQTLPHDGDSIMVSRWPQYEKSHCFPQAAADMQCIMEAVRAIRNRRSEMNVPPSRKTHLYIDSNDASVFEAGREIMKKLAYASEVEIGTNYQLEGVATIVTASAKLYIPMSELVDKKAELDRLSKELESAKKQYQNAQDKLNNEKFMSKAPANVVDGVKQNAAKLSDHIALIQSSIDALKQ